MAKSGDGDAGGRVYLAGQGLSGPGRPHDRSGWPGIIGALPAGRNQASGRARRTRAEELSFLHAITPSADVGRP